MFEYNIDEIVHIVRNNRLAEVKIVSPKFKHSAYDTFGYTVKDISLGLTYFIEESEIVETHMPINKWHTAF